MLASLDEYFLRIGVSFNIKIANRVGKSGKKWVLLRENVVILPLEKPQINELFCRRLQMQARRQGARALSCRISQAVERLARPRYPEEGYLRGLHCALPYGGVGTSAGAYS